MDSFIKKKLKLKIFTYFIIKLMYRITTRFCIKLRKLPMTDNNESTDLLAQALWDKIEDEWVSEDEDNDWVSEKVVWVSEGDDDWIPKKDDWVSEKIVWVSEGERMSGCPKVMMITGLIQQAQ